MTFVIFLLQNKVEAKSYTITDMDILAGKFFSDHPGVMLICACQGQKGKFAPGNLLCMSRPGNYPHLSEIQAELTVQIFCDSLPVSGNYTLDG